MASRRLNNGLRSQIIDKLLERTFPPRFKEMEKRFGAWLVGYHKLWHAGHEAILQQMPDRAAVTVMSIEVYPRHRSHSESAKCQVDYPLKSFHDFPNGYSYIETIEAQLIKVAGKNKKVDDNLAELRDLFKELDALRAEHKKASQEAMAILRSVQTYKSLLEIWPEIAEVIGSEEAPKSQRALVKNLSALNLTLGLTKPPQPLLKKKGK